MDDNKEAVAWLVKYLNELIGRIESGEVQVVACHVSGPAEVIESDGPYREVKGSRIETLELSIEHRRTVVS